jgi:hypothetical protein
MKQATLIGHDSEFGLARGGIIQSALDVLGDVVHEDDNGRYFADNLNTEVAINPVSTLKDFHSKTEGLLGKVRDLGFDLLMEPVIKYPDSCLLHKDAFESGCNPDLSAYTEHTNSPPDFNKMDGTRSCGAHIHTGDLSSDPINQSKWMDALITLPLLFKETPSERRKLYGGAGCLRYKPYGMEYRTLSNVWLDSPELREFVWERTHMALALSKSTDFSVIEDWWEIPQAIDQHDLVAAARLLDRLYIYGVTAA